MASAVKEKITCHMTAILKALDCAICLSIIKSPVSMGCGHFFCRFCIVEVLKSNYRTPCPLCKRSFTRRSIENADQRNRIVLAAGKLALECGKVTGANIVSPDTLSLLQDDDTVFSPTNSLNEAKEGPKPSKPRKRKSQENVSEKVSSSTSCAATTDSEAKVQNPDVSSASAKILQRSKRQCQSWNHSDESEDCELPSLDDILAFVKKSNVDKQLETNDKLDVQENKPSSGSNKKCLKVSFADTCVSSDLVDSSSCTVPLTAKEPNDAFNNKGSENNRESSMVQPKKSKASKLRETIKNKKNALKNKTNQIISDGNESIINKTPGNKKKSVDNSTNNLDDEKAKENINKNLNVSSSCTNEASMLVLSPKSSTKEKSKTKPSKFRSNKAVSDCEAMISKLKAAEDFTLTVVNTRSTSNPTSMNVPDEGFSLNETNLHCLQENADDCEMEYEQLGQKEEQSHITDTAVSVQSVASPTANKLETLSKSPGWSKVRQVGKDFRVKKFSRLPVEKNSSNSCPIESDVLENSSGGLVHEMPKLIRISELERESLDKNEGSDLVNGKFGCKQNAQNRNKISLEHGTMTVTAEVHSQELNDSNSKEKELSDQSGGNKNSSNYDETETSIVMSSVEKVQVSPLDKSISCNQNISNTAKKVSEESTVNFNGSCIPSPEMHSLKPSVTKVLDLATDINGSAEIEFQNESELSKNVQDTLTNTFDSHMIENDMDIDENHEHALPVLGNEVRPYTKQIIEKVSGLDIYNKQRNWESKSSKLPPKFASVSKSVTTGTKSLFAGEETVYFASHSQQTSQRLLEVWDDNSARNHGALVPEHTFGLSRYPVQKFGIENIQNQVAPFNKRDSSEKTKVLKRTCLTLDEIQDAFDNCRSGHPVTICSLPFSSGEYRLDINVADETLNISVLKVGSFEIPKETVEKTSTLLYAEKNIQTSNSFPSPTTVLPSSNTGSETSQPDNSDTTKPAKNLFPYLNQYFSDSDPSQQCNIPVEDTEDPLELSEVLPYTIPDNLCNPDQEPEKSSDVVKSMKTLLSQLQALPCKDFSLSGIQIVRESSSVYDKVENGIQDIESADALPAEDLAPFNVQRIISNIADHEMGRNTVKETLRQSNAIVISCPTKKPDESLQYDDLPPTQEAINKADILEANKTKHMASSKDHTQKKSFESFKKPTVEGYVNNSSTNNSLELKILKANESTNQKRPGKRNSSSACERQKTFPSSVSSINKSQHLSLMEKYSAEESDPDLAMVAELVGPLKELAEEMKASDKAPSETSMICREKNGNQKRPLEIFEEMVLSKNNESSGMCLPSQKASRLSLKSKGGNPKKFKRIQRYSCSEDSDSDKEDIKEKDASPKHKEVISSDSKDNGTIVSPNDHGITHSFASEDLTNGNTSDIAMEIESLDEKIKSVMTKLKDIGREDLLVSENDPDLSKVNEELSSSLCNDDDAASDDSQKSTDIFSVPPTPPDAMSSDHENLKTKWKN